jgi:hypothetical protein
MKFLSKKAPTFPVLFLFLSIFVSSVSYGQVLSGWDHYMLNTSFHNPKQTIEASEASHDSLNTERSEVLERRRRLNAERSEAIERHEVPIPQSSQLNQSNQSIQSNQSTVYCPLPTVD